MTPARLLALLLPLVLASAARAEPSDGGVPADAATAVDAAPLADAAPAVTLAPRALPAPTPPLASDAALRAHPTPLHKSALFWTSIALGAAALVAIAVGVGLAASTPQRYAVVAF